MITQEQIEKQEKLVKAYREEFNQSRELMEASRKRATRAVEKLQNLKGMSYLTTNGRSEMELIA